MSGVKGLVVRLKTASIRKWAGTDDPIYIGVVGKGGGREFALDVEGFNDFEKGTDVKYWFGTVWEGDVLVGAKKPYHSDADADTRRWNMPSHDDIELDLVDYVYLRKASFLKDRQDDRYLLNEVEVTLYASSPSKRTFRRTTIALANEFGLQVWLPELDRSVDLATAAYRTP